MLSQLSKAPLLPMAYRASSVWQLRSWDRFMLPRPFSRIVIALEAPLAMTREDTADEFSKGCIRLDNSLGTASRTCEEYLANR